MIKTFILGLILSIASLFGYHQPTQAPIVFGSVTPVQGTQFYLAGAGVTSSATSIQLTSFQTPDGRNLTMSMFGTIGYGALEPGTSKLEDITFTGITQNGNGTATLTGVTRGNDFITPYAASTTLAKAHSGGSTFILSNTAGFYTQFMPVNNTATSTAVLVFSSTTPPTYDGEPVWANFGTKILADVTYVNSVVAAGAANASETVKGIIQLATGAQAAAGTSSGSTGARLALGANLASSTPSATTPTGTIPTTVGQYLSQAWLDLTATWTWTGLGTFSGGLTSTATSTFNGSNVLSNAIVINTVPYQFPSTQGAANSVWLNNGSGVLTSSSISRKVFATTTTATITSINGTATAMTTTVPANIMGTTGGIRGRFYGSITTNGGSSNARGFSLSYGGTTCVTSSTMANTSGTYTGYIDFEILNASASSQSCNLVFEGLSTNTLVSFVGTGTAAVDSTQNRTLILGFVAADTNESLIIYNGTVEQIF